MPLSLSLVSFSLAVVDDESLSRIVSLPEPVLRIEHEGTSCWSLDWANSEVIAVGLTNGKFQDIVYHPK